ncbi:hypothetical protein QJQ45_026456 [Haematococcus lacustris]|nr:hypothetical protein QJQ45_026456 [Haematococcus lacustris]
MADGVAAETDSGSGADTVNGQVECSPQRGMDGSNKRYDRQIRIWGAHGQQRLEKCRVVLLNCGPTGSETLKNLVLGGIASFTVVDGAKVSARDLGNNFMVESSRLGEPRAKVVTELVKELNDAVAGSYVEESPEQLLATNPQFIAEFTVVIATQRAAQQSPSGYAVAHLLRHTAVACSSVCVHACVCPKMCEGDLVRLDEECRKHNVLLLAVRSYGLMGWLRPSIPEHHVVESKPDNIVDDLRQLPLSCRLYQPWPQLLELALSFDLAALDDITHRHLPFVLLLVQAGHSWRTTHGGSPPASSKERAAFKEELRGLRRTLQGVAVEVENFEEAEKAAFHVWTPYVIPSEVRELLEDEAASAAAQGLTTPVFWVMVAALKLFVAHEGEGTYLPLDGSIPDMHSTTDLYLRVQRLYRERAERDVSSVEAHVNTLLARAGRDAGSIPRETIRHYCKNARNLRLVRYRSLAAEFASTASPSDSKPRGASPSLAQSLASEGTAATAALYVLLRAADRFLAAHGRFPGCRLEGSGEEDAPLLKSLAHAVMAEMGAASASLQDDYLQEMVRFGAGELHVVAAFMGGMAAQEIIKLVTGQFTPVAGTMVYTAMGCITSCFEF